MVGIFSVFSGQDVSRPQGEVAFNTVHLFASFMARGEKGLLEMHSGPKCKRPVEANFKKLSVVLGPAGGAKFDADRP